jgi:hypothetical protein
MSIPELEVKCWQCWGTGMIPSDNHHGMTECPECGGVGWIPTEDGQRLLDFLERHLPFEIEEKNEFMV